MDKFRGKTAVVTGAGSGIGRALALGLAQRGARLALSDVNADRLAETAWLLGEAQPGIDLRTDVLDVSDKGAFERYADAVYGRFGAIHQLYNNAGITLGSGPLLEMQDNHMQQIVDVNLWGVIWGTRVFLPHLIASGDGVLVTISSLNGLMAQSGLSMYCATKFAVRGFTETVRCEMIDGGHAVQVTVVHPGGIKTNIANAAIPQDMDMTAEKRQEAERRAQYYNDKLLKMTPETAARIILEGVGRGRSRIVITPAAVVLDKIVRLLPALYPALTTRLFARLM